MSLSLNNSKHEIKITITLENGTDLTGVDTVGPLNAILNAFLISVEMELGALLLTDRNTKYSYRVVIANFINYDKLIAYTRLLPEVWKKDPATHCEVTKPAGENAELTAQTALFPSSNVVTRMGRRHVDLFHQEN